MDILNISHYDLRPADASGGQDLVVLLNVDDRRARGGYDRARVLGRGGTTERGELCTFLREDRDLRREGDGAKVGEGDERAALLVVLDDPLRVLLAQRRAGRDRLGHGLALGHVLDDCRARRGAARGDRELDGIAARERDAREVVRVVGVPLVPGCQ